MPRSEGEERITHSREALPGFETGVLRSQFIFGQIQKQLFAVIAADTYAKPVVLLLCR